MKPICENIVIYQGADWRPVLQWLSETPTHKLITGVQVGLPTLLTVPGHGITGTDRVPVWITNVQGPRALNTDDYTAACPRWATVVDAETLAVDFDSGALNAYVKGGVLTYRQPVDLTGWTAREEIRASIDAPTPLKVLTTGAGITLGADGSIRRVLSATDTTALPLNARVHMLELTDPAGVVTRFAQGDVTVNPDFLEPAP